MQLLLNKLYKEYIYINCMYHIIGSGLGGTVIALILTKLGYQVKILEQHTNFGGSLHSFKKNDHIFEVGLHYMGKPVTKLWSFLTGGKILFSKIEGPHDIFYVKDEKWEFGNKNEQIELYNKLLGHKKTKQYIKLLCKVQRSFTIYMVLNLILGVKLAEVICYYITPLVFTMEKRSVVDVLTNDFNLDPKTIGILTYFWGNLGQLPSNMSFLIHTLLTTHWWDGNYYPQGGSDKLITLLRKNLKQNKIPVSLGEKVLQYDKNDNTLKTNKASYNPHNIIVSCGLRSWAKITDKTMPPGCMSFFMIHVALDGTPKELNLPTYNLWIGNSYDVENDWNMWDSPEGLPPICFISFTCAKDTTFNSSYSTGCIICPCKLEWRQDPEFKTKLNNTLINIFKKHFPNVPIIDSYPGTPYTFDHYIGSVDGCIYGNEKTGKINYNKDNSNVYYSGQDVFMPGISGAAVSSFLCARQITPLSLRYAYVLI